MDPSTKTLIKLTNGFSPEVPLARYDDMIRSVCAGADEEDREELEKFRGEIAARREAGLKKRAELKEGVASDANADQTDSFPGCTLDKVSVPDDQTSIFPGRFLVQKRNIGCCPAQRVIPLQWERLISLRNRSSVPRRNNSSQEK